MYNHRQVKIRLITLALILCLLPITALYFVNQKQTLDVAVSDLQNQNRENVNLVDKELSKMRQTALLLAGNPAWERYYTEPERRDYWKEEQDNALVHVSRHIPEMDSASLIDVTRHGAETAKVVHGQAAASDQLSPSKQNQPFFLHAFTKEEGQVYQSAPYVSPETRRWVFGNTTPIFIHAQGSNHGQKVALLHEEVNLESLTQMLQSQASQETEAVIISRDGTLIASSEPSHLETLNTVHEIAETMSEERFERFQQKVILPLADGIVGNASLWHDMTNQPFGNSQINQNGQAYLIAYQSLDTRNDWIMATLRPVPSIGQSSLLNRWLLFGTAVLVLASIAAGSLIIHRILKAVQWSQERLNYMAHRDTLTDLPNRVLFHERVQHMLSEQPCTPFALMFIDLDRFKVINDTLGHSVGDELLQHVSKRLSACVREGDTVARFGGDEFTIFMPRIAGPQDAAQVAQRILESLAEPIVLVGNEYVITTCIGISLFPDHGDDLETLTKNADLAMYRAKELGKNNYQFYTEDMNSQNSERLLLESQLRRALERDQFHLFYQPKVDMRTGEVVGMEALIRWRHPELGVVSPAQFIPLAEETGVIVPIGEWVIRTACQQNRAWQDAGYNPLRVSVNLSGRQFQHSRLVDTIKGVLDETGLEAKWLELEITESILMHNGEVTADTLMELKRIGVYLSVDDFGTGYSSLSYLKRFSVDTLKIDRSFIRDITTNPDDVTITVAVITMAQSLNLRVVAEGVETVEQFELLKSNGCDEVQGYLFSPPVPAEHFKKFLSRSNEST